MALKQVSSVSPVHLSSPFARSFSLPSTAKSSSTFSTTGIEMKPSPGGDNVRTSQAHQLSHLLMPWRCLQAPPLGLRIRFRPPKSPQSGISKLKSTLTRRMACQSHVFYVEFRWSFIASSVRPGKSLAIVAHLLPRRACTWTILAASSVNMMDDVAPRRNGPCCSKSLIRVASSCGLQEHHHWQSSRGRQRNKLVL